MNEVVSAKGHLFQKGKSGNPAGRPKGSRNAITLVKLQIEGELRAQMKGVMPEIIKEAIRQALPSQSPRTDKNGHPVLDQAGNQIIDTLPGNAEMIKLLYGSWISKTKAGDDEAPKEKIQIVIGKLDQVPPVNGQVFQQSEE